MNLLRRHLMAASLGLAGCGSVPMPVPAAAGPARPQQAQSLDVVDAEGRTRRMRFWLHLPSGYTANGEPWREPWPMLFFLHGSGERGTDLDLVKVHGPPKQVAQGLDLPFVLVSPQLEEGRRWDVVALQALNVALQARLRVDPRRVTATGLSLGGHGVWLWAARFPDALAAIAPVCGFGQPADACALKQVPVRAYHGAVDSVVPLKAQQAMVDAHRACGGQVEFIVYPGVDHDAWNLAYADPALYPWLLAARAQAAKAPA